jgi:hypothetical protein
MDTSKLAGHLAAWNYFQSIDTPANRKFAADFKAFCKKNNLPGGEARVVDDPIEAAYFGVYVWKAAAEKAGSFDVDKVKEAGKGSASAKVDASTGQPAADAGKASASGGKADAGVGDKAPDAAGSSLCCDALKVLDSKCASCHGASTAAGAPRISTR